MCGSSGFSADFLNLSIATLDAQVAEVKSKGEQARARHTAASAAVESATSELSRTKMLLLRCQDDLAATKVIASDCAESAEEMEAKVASIAAQIPQLELLRDRITKAKAQLTHMVDDVGGQSASDEDIHRIDADLAAIQKDMSANAVRIMAMADLSQLETEERAARAESSRIDSFCALLSDATARRTAQQARLDSCLIQVAQAKDIKDEVAAHSPFSAESLMKLISEVEAKQAARNEATGAIRVARESLCTANTRTTELELRAAESAGVRKIVDDLILVRNSFQPGGAIGKYLRHKFVGMSNLVSDYLAHAGADFAVTPSSDVDLAYDFLRTTDPDGVWMPQSRMSGGQRVRLAVVTLLAVHARLLPNLGLLVLDEPTTHVHTDGVAAMAEMFRGIAEQGQLQMIICDHNPVLTDSFTHVIDVA
jgi:DNA repair exonuclease SbcCD ATPase subunit